MTAMTTVEIVGVYANAGAGSLVLLADAQTSTRVLPIMIGSPEAQAIAFALSGAQPARPGTHDLMAALLDRSGMRLDEVAITELRDGVFYAELFLETMSGLHRETARPSDAVALALRCGAPIVVAPSVLDDASVQVHHSVAEPFSDDEIDEIVDEFRTHLSTASPQDFEPEQSDSTATGGAGSTGRPGRPEGEPDEDVSGDD